MNVSIFCCSSETILKHIRFYQHNLYKHEAKTTTGQCSRDKKPFLFLWLPAAAHQSCLCDMLSLHLPGSLLSFFCLNETKGCFCSRKHHYRLCSEELELKIVSHLCQNDTWIEKQRVSREQLEAKPL